ncbi:hypothetical protein HNR44_002656 [Geomicrobium halophilum]|uniref:Uncharacterized protein n=1 Tax=Geomicrobium halophilum TaxID=549000 RepID=A0A841PU36_9BACL|nr:hypothetical protein [Geomicrobium halophilum]MBB6450666.1 hypothetical protein [Geomicrobium halophilum]
MTDKELNPLLNKVHGEELVEPKWRTYVYIGFLELKERVNLQGLLTIFGVPSGGLLGIFFLLDWEQMELLHFVTALVFIAIVFAMGSLYIKALAEDVMSNPDTKHFNVAVYKRKRPLEYEALSNLALERDYAHTMSQEITAVIEKNANIDEITQIAHEYEMLLEEAIKDAEEYKNDIQYIFQILAQFKTHLNLMARDRFNLSVIDYGVQYSLYKQIEDQLILVDYAGGEIEVLDEEISVLNNEHPYVQALRLGGGKESQFNKEDGTIRWTMKMYDDRNWVFTIYIRETDDPEVKDLLEGSESSIMRLTVIQDMLYFCCLIVNKLNELRQDKHREGANDESE